MKNLLYIHGLKMSKDSVIISNAISASNADPESQEYDKSTLDLTNIKKGASFTNIKELFATLGYDSINASFDLFDIDGTFDKIRDIVQKNKVSLVIASSLGGFYALSMPSSVPVIALNPCIKPSFDVPRLHTNIPAGTVEGWQKLEAGFTLLKPIYKRAKFAVFAKNDELFHYKGDFDSIFGTKSSVLVEGPHQLSHYRTFLDPSIEIIMPLMKVAKVL